MKTVRIVIIEDEKPAARLLNRRIEKLGYPVEMLLHSVEESVEWFQSNPHPDLIFLDIQLSDGLSFELFDQVSIDSAIIFTTAYDDYVLKAFKLNSIDYLLKPIVEEELLFALDKFQRQQPREEIDLAAVKRWLQPQKVYKERFTIKVGQSLKIIECTTIDCFFSEYKATYLHTHNAKNYLLDFSLDKLETLLDPLLFFRINRSTIIQRGAIREITMYSNSRLKIRLATFNDSELIVSREKVNDFKGWLEK